ncbi:hypothetical protein [Variovorax sp. RA8]|uniref:hypothetical protein n=1 Tax=Variovorax sp. (strain JCM 16519 / RA8) TaxID=662548 RepID=UPI0013A59FA6|nr:hypothetical protein [Variovorax sp. RA8]
MQNKLAFVFSAALLLVGPVDASAADNANRGAIPWVLDVQGFPGGQCTTNDLVSSFEEARRWGRESESDGMIQLRSVNEGPDKIVYMYFDRMIKSNSTRTFYRTIEACKADRRG